MTATDRKEQNHNLIHRVNVGDALLRTAAHHPDREAVVDGDRRFTYRALDAWANRFANALASRGYARGDSLAVMSGNSLEFLVAYYACAKLGVVCVPINLGWKDQETAYVLGHASARGIVVETQLVLRAEAAMAGAPSVQDVFVARGLAAAWSHGLPRRSYFDLDAFTRDASDAGPEVVILDRDPVTYLYTSGTTAAPKGVVGTHLAVHVESMTTAIDLELRKSDRILCMMPMFHTAQLNAFCTPAVTVGATMVLQRAFDAARVLSLMESERLTVIFALPMMVRALVEAKEAATTATAASTTKSPMRLCVYAMAPMPNHELLRAIDAFGCDFALLFGQTEMSPVATIFRPEHQLSHMGAVGTPGVNVQVAILSEDGKVLPRGERGEIVYRSPHAVERYLNDEAATDAAFRDGWFHSGDAGHMGQDGMLWFEDRFKDVIKTGGENVASIEVEKLVYHVEPAIAQAVVIGLPHSRWGEAITVVAVLHPGKTADPAAVIARLKAALAPFKVPKSVLFLDALPMTSTGKVQKHELRKKLAKHYDDGR